MSTETELRELATVVDELLAERRDPTDGQRFDTALWDMLVDNGFAYVDIDEQAGGSGGGLREAAVILRAVGQHAAAVPLADVVLAGGLLAACDAQIDSGLTVFGGGELTAVADGDGVRVTGRLVRVPGGRDAHTIVGLADTLVVAVPVAEGELVEGHNLAGEARDDLIVDTVLPVTAVHSGPAGVAAELRLRLALSRAVLSAGALSGLVAQTGRYVQERHQFGRPLAAFQAVQQSVAQLAAEAVAAETAADSAVRICAEHGFGSRAAELAVAAAKVRTAQAATVGAAAAHQMHGAIGMTQEHPLRHLTTRLWSWRSEGGGEKQWADRLGELAVTAGGAGLWPVLTDA